MSTASAALGGSETDLGLKTPVSHISNPIRLLSHWLFLSRGLNLSFSFAESLVAVVNADKEPNMIELSRSGVWERHQRV